MTTSSTNETSAISTTNGLVACTPFPARHIEKKVVGGMVLIANKIDLQQLEVVFPASGEGCEQYAPGVKVWLRGDLYTQQWAKDVYTIGDKTFILVPKNFIQLVEELYVNAPSRQTLKTSGSGMTLVPTAILVDGNGMTSISGNYTDAIGAK